jgi:hypothetical protein
LIADKGSAQPLSARHRETAGAGRVHPLSPCWTAAARDSPDYLKDQSTCRLDQPGGPLACDEPDLRGKDAGFELVGGNSQLIGPTEYSFEVARIGGDGSADLVERKVSVIAEPACAGADLPGLRAAICRASPAGTVILRSEDPRGAPRRSSAGGGRRPGSGTRVPEPKEGTHTRVAGLCPGDTGWWPVTDRRRAGVVKMTQDEQRAFVADWVPIFSLLGPMWFLRLATAAGMGVIYLAVTASMFARPGTSPDGRPCGTSGGGRRDALGAGSRAPVRPLLGCCTAGPSHRPPGQPACPAAALAGRRSG